MKEGNEEIRNILESIPEHFHILKSKTDWNIHSEFIELTEKLNSQNGNEKSLILESEKLFLDETQISLKKIVLVRLGNLGTVQAYRILEKFYEISDKELKTWAALALQECFILMESQLTGENSGFISTGLGGEEQNLRYFFVIFTKNKAAFTLSQKSLIKIEFELISENLNSTTEKIDFHSDYSSLTVLIPMDIAPETFIMNGINKCNEIGSFIVPHYFVTNNNIPPKEELLEIIAKIRNDIDNVSG